MDMWENADASARIIEDLGLNWTAAQRYEYLSKVKVVDLPRLDEPYPIDNYFAAGTPKAKYEWEAYWEGKSLKDPRDNRGLRREIVDVDYSRFRYIIQQDESVIFRDAATKEIVLVVLRNFIPNEELRMTMVDTCKEIIKYRRDDRREDPGMLVHFGYTCGPRHKPQIQMAACCLALNTEEKQARENRLNDDAQGMAGIMWNLMRSRLPPEIIADYNDTIAKNDFPRMDMMKDDGTFTYKVNDEDAIFETGENGLELPPPSGLSAINYARYTHKEVNGNNWIIACTCNAPDDPTKGGNFYLASYGIMMLPASNTVSAWHPGDHHGTTLYEMMEGKERRAGFEVRQDGGFNTGLVFEISRSLGGARKKSTWLDERKLGISKHHSEPDMLQDHRLRDDHQDFERGRPLIRDRRGSSHRRRTRKLKTRARETKPHFSGSESDSGIILPRIASIRL
ncbi:hypothetical protein F5Y13DRAFT_199620 [Hypoxylon sp. FL1857]|nr:hypothetical protein F5Y13DRAFT_199620 [Hypoxylon sp. FL1857]